MNALAGIGSRTARGVVWALTASGVSRLAWLAALAVLARLLVPAQFGLFAFGLVFVTYVETLGDLGTGAALIHWPSRSREGTGRAARVTFGANLVLGISWLLLAQALAPWVARFFHHPEGEPILRALALGFVIKGLGNTHDALCQKELAFRARLVPEAALAVGKATTAVLLAFAGLGVWALVWGQLLGLALQTAALWWVVPWRPWHRPGAEAPTEGWARPSGLAGRMFAYGRGLVAVNVLAAVVHHADLVVVGRMLGASALGLYQMATKLPEVTVTLLVWVVGRVLFPAFSKLHAAGEELGPAYLEAARYIAALTLPAAAGLFLVAGPAVEILFGASWAGAVPILRALAVYAGLRSLGSHAGDVLKATGRSGLLAGLAMVKAAVLIPVLVVAGRLSAPAVAWALAGVTAGTVLLNLVVVCRILGVRPGAVAGALRPGAAATAVMVGAVVVWQRLGREIVAAGGPVIHLAASVVLGIGVYVAALAVVDRGLMREVMCRLRGESSAALEEGA